MAAGRQRNADVDVFVFYLTSKISKEEGQNLIALIEAKQFRDLVVAVKWPYERSGTEEDIESLSQQAAVEGKPFQALTVAHIDDESPRDEKVLIADFEDGRVRVSRRMLASYAVYHVKRMVDVDGDQCRISVPFKRLFRQAILVSYVQILTRIKLDGGIYESFDEAGESFEERQISENLERKERFKASAELIAELYDVVKNMDPATCCPHHDLDRDSPPVQATPYTDCPAPFLWRRNGQLERSTDAQGLIAKVDARPSLFAQVHAIQALSPRERFTNIILRLLPLIFQVGECRIEIDTSVQVCKDFNRPFYGNAVASLISYTLQCQKFASKNPNVVYGNTFPILQSSGTGKTKLAVQLSAQQAGFLVCLRNPHDHDARIRSATVPFPQSDQRAYEYFRQFLVGMRPDPSKRECQSFQRHHGIAKWLGAYLDTLADAIQTRLQKSGCFDHDDDGGDDDDADDDKRYRRKSRQSKQVNKLGHPSIENCWDSVVYSLALDVHNGPDFIDHYSFEKGESPTMPLCPYSRLTPSSYDDTIDSSNTAPRSGSSNQQPLPYRTRLMDKIHAKVASQTTAAPKSATTTSAQKEGEIIQFPQDAAAMHIREPLERLENLLPAALKGKRFFFLCLDEVIKFEPLLPIFRRLWRESNPSCTWLYFVDTDSNIAHLPGEKAEKASLRLERSENGLILYPPFIYLPFDVDFVPKAQDYRQRLLDKRLTHNHIIDLIRLFGRPLWSTGLYQDSWTSAQDEVLYRPHLPNILIKLLPERASEPEIWPKSQVKNHDGCIFTLLGQRLPLFFVGHQNIRRTISTQHSGLDVRDSPRRSETSRKLQQDLVSHHLRIVSELYNTDFFRTSTPSEPPLSLAAAFLFRGGDCDDVVHQCLARWSTAIGVLAKTHRSSGVMLGEEGEEGVRLLCNIAADQIAAIAIDSVRQNFKAGTLPSQHLELFKAHAQYICLKDWLVCFLGVGETKISEVLVDSKNLRQDLLAWAADHYINFTHWMKVPGEVKPGHMDPMMLAEHWMRQAAFYGSHNQPQWDLVIPIYYSPQSPPSWESTIEPNNFSYVAIQVKNRHRGGATNSLFGPCHWVDTAPTDATTPRMTTRPTCLELFFDLRAPQRITLTEVGISNDTKKRKVLRIVKAKPSRSSKASAAIGETHDPSPSSSTSAPPSLDEPTCPASRADDEMDLDEVEEIWSPSVAGPGATVARGADQQTNGGDSILVDEVGSDEVFPDCAYNLLINGSSIGVLPILNGLTEAAREDLYNLFGFDEYDKETHLRTLYADIMHVESIKATHRTQHAEGPLYLTNITPTAHRGFARNKRPPKKDD